MPEQTYTARLQDQELASLQSSAPAPGLSEDDFKDDAGKGMFRPLVADHGVLPPGRIFGPRLHPALGGAMEPGSFRPAEATAAVSLIVQAEPIILRGHTGRGMRDVRPIGP